MMMISESSLVLTLTLLLSLCGMFPLVTPLSQSIVSTLPPVLQSSVMALSSVPGQQTKYKQLLFLGGKMKELESRDEEDRVKGCMSTVYVKGLVKESGGLEWKGYSDSMLTRGLLALILTGIDGCEVEEVVNIDENFISVCGIDGLLTPGRNNGFLNMLKLIKQKARELGGGAIVDNVDVNDEISGAESIESTETETTETEEPTAEENNSGSSTPIQDLIESRLQALNPTTLHVINKSASHAHHPGSSGADESHFQVTMWASAFEDIGSLARHRLVYDTLGDIMGKVHAVEVKCVKAYDD